MWESKGWHVMVKGLCLHSMLDDWNIDRCWESLKKQSNFISICPCIMISGSTEGQNWRFHGTTIKILLKVFLVSQTKLYRDYLKDFFPPHGKVGFCKGYSSRCLSGSFWLFQHLMTLVIPQKCFILVFFFLNMSQSLKFKGKKIT